MTLPEIIEFPDIEAALVGYLPDRVGVPASTAVPNPRPERFVLIRRTGGTRTSVAFEQPMLTIECWGPDTVAAISLARLTRAHLSAAPGRMPGVVRYQEFSGPANLPDPESTQARYTWTCAIDVRGHAI